MPYKGSGPAITDVIGGHVPVMFINRDAALPHVQAGKLRALAVTSPERSPVDPDVPTVAGSGYSGFSAQSWTGLSAPAKTPKAIIDKVHEATVKALKGPKIANRLESVGFVVVGGYAGGVLGLHRGRNREVEPGHPRRRVPGRVKPSGAFYGRSIGSRAR